MSDQLKARLTESSQGYTVSAFLPEEPPTPGNVALCISGGGSRSLSAGMGQLRGLKVLKIGDDDLIALAKAISTVSGGSWVGSTFVYLRGDTTDDEYLNLYVPDQGRLVPTRTAGHSQAETLDELPEGNIGNRISRKLFSIPLLAIQAFLFFKVAKTPPSQLWQALIGLYILNHYGLFPFNRHFVPTSLFTYDEKTRKNDVTFGGTQLEDVQADLVAAGPGRTRRPYLICNTAMFLKKAHDVFKLLAPVQCTPFFCGIVGMPRGEDNNGRKPGGGGVTSFGLGSELTQVQGCYVEIDQDRQFALADAIGCSSAAFAEGLQNLFAQWAETPGEMIQLMKDSEKELLELFHEHAGLKAELEVVLDTVLKVAEDEVAATVRKELADLREIIPEYKYWPVRDAEPASDIKPTRFADAGSLENSAVVDALVYTDIENVICFVNTNERFEATDKGVIGPDGQEIPDTRVKVADMIPPLYGYQPYAKGKGYVLYEGADKPNFPEGMHNQVFDSGRFAEVLQGLWQASDHNSRPAVFQQKNLAVHDNTWFGVQGDGRKIKLLWVHLSRVREWYNQLSAEVQQILGDFDDPSSFYNFPYYNTLETDLSATQVNLLANLTAWVVAADDNREVFLDMYR